MDKTIKNYRVEKQISFIGIVWSIIGLIAGILFPMIYMVPMLFSSWVLFASVGHNSWANAYLMINYNSPQVYIPLFIIEGIVFLVGCTIFFLGLTQMVKSKLRNEQLLTTGIYRIIRHPQNLGIILMIFPFSLMLPFKTIGGYWIDLGIRTGDMMSWLLMSTLIIISSLIEEKLFIKKLGENGEKYRKYRSETGMMFPRIRRSRKQREYVLWKQIIIVICIYGVIVLSSFLAQKILSIYEIVVWTKTF